MIQLRDLNPRYTTPFVTVFIIIVNTLVWFYQVSLGPAVGERFIFALGLIPARFDLALTSHVGSLGDAALPLVTSMFLHGGWMHIIGNMWFLWIFGDNVEDRRGNFVYLVVYIACGLAAGIVHTILNWGSQIPTVGASGAISGVLGAYMVFYPRSRIVTLVPLIFFFFTVQLAAYFFLGYWIVLQFLGGFLTQNPKATGGTAWFAHIGGFALGFILAKLLAPRPQSPYVYR